MINVSEIQAIKKEESGCGLGCTVFMKDGEVYKIASVSDETYESAIAYICCGG